jgi:alpha-tubulin suppressor-like RCC1 family protein
MPERVAWADTLIGWGRNQYGQVDSPEMLSGILKIAAGEYHNLALRSDGTVTGWGDDFSGQATPPSDLGEVIAICDSMGPQFSTAIGRHRPGKGR